MQQPSNKINIYKKKISIANSEDFTISRVTFIENPSNNIDLRPSQVNSDFNTVLPSPS